MKSSCCRTCCSEERQHSIFLNLGSILTIPICCHCYSEIYSRCETINEIVGFLEKLNLQPSSLWVETNSNPKEMHLPEGIQFIIKFLLELLQQLELLLTTSYTSIDQISKYSEIVQCNFNFIRTIDHKYRCQVNK